MHESTFMCGKDTESSVPYKKIYVLKYYMANEVQQ